MFSEVENKNLLRPTYSELAFDSKNLPSFNKIIPIKDSDRLQVAWVIEN